MNIDQVNLKYKENKGTDGVPEAFYPEQESNMLLLRYPALEKTGIVRHCFSTKLGGVSEGIFATMNLSFTRGDKQEAVEENYRRLANALGVTCDSFVFSDQTHTTNVRVVTKEDAGKGLIKDRDYSDIDGLITNVQGLVLATFYADCVPLYFVDVRNKAIGLCHSGWRGTVARIGKVTVEAMQREYKTKPEELICAIGPSICQDCYEVSSDVAEAFLKEFSGHEQRILLDKQNGKFQLNLWEANKQILLDAGVKESNISCTNLCTCCNEHLLFSHRATNGKRGNLGAFLGLM
jgi:YfiH family protein